MYVIIIDENNIKLKKEEKFGTVKNRNNKK